MIQKDTQLPKSLTDLGLTNESMLEALNTALSNVKEAPEPLSTEIRDKLLQLKELLTIKIDTLKEILEARKLILMLSQKFSKLKRENIKLLNSVNDKLGIEPLKLGIISDQRNSDTPTLILGGEAKRRRIKELETLMARKFNTYYETINIAKVRKFVQQFSLTDKIYALTILSNLSDVESKNRNVLLLLILAEIDADLARGVYADILDISLKDPYEIEKKALNQTEQQIEYIEILLKHLEETLKKFSLYDSNNQ